MIRNVCSVSIAAALFGFCAPSFASEGSSDGFPPAQNFSATHAPGADRDLHGTTVPLGGGNQYLFLSGSAFTPRTSGQTVTYPGGGCAYSDDALTTSLELPNAALIEGVRVYYYSTSASTSIAMYLTTYQGDGTFSDLLTGSTELSGGYSDEYFDADPALTINNLDGSYVLTALLDAGTRLCGMRVFYTP